MTTFELIQAIVGTLSAIALVATLAAMAVQMMSDRNLREYQLFQHLAQEYTELLWRPAENPCLNKIWHPLDAQRIAELDGALDELADKQRWPVWAILDGDEHQCYRLTRAGLELFEQAHTGFYNGWVSDDQTWQKWENWMVDWKRTNTFVTYVLAENAPWFTNRFLKYFQQLPVPSDQHTPKRQQA
ncbi:MAG: hypothetical protein WD294_00475 [Phycisphaeraceae bacterium]